MALIVDEAHGTHFAFCPSILPVPAVSHGADIVIQSAHKTVPSLTQASYLHLSFDAVGHGRILPAHVREALSMISTSSPSFLIAATLDFARAYLEENGDRASKKLFSSLVHFYDLLDPAWLPCFKHPYEEDIQNSADVSYDPFRMVITVRNMPFTAQDVFEELSGHGIAVEFHDLLRLVLICKFENTKEDFVLLASVLNHFLNVKNAEFEKEDIKKPLMIRIDHLEQLDLRFRQIMSSIPNRLLPPHCSMVLKNRAESIPLREAAGRALFSAIVPYPPGVPMIWPGEVITEEAIHVLEALLAYGYSVYGIEDIFVEDSGKAVSFIHCIREDDISNFQI